MNKENKTLEKVSTVAGAYAGTETGLDLAMNLLSKGCVVSDSMIFATEFAFMLIGCGIGAFVGNKGGKTCDKLLEKKERCHE